MVGQEQHDTRSEQEEDVLRESVRGPGVPACIDDGGDHQQGERRADEIPSVEARPERVDHVRDQEAEEDLCVGKRHAAPRAATGREFKIVCQSRALALVTLAFGPVRVAEYNRERAQSGLHRGDYHPVAGSVFLVGS